jgi:hypothetical protein
MKVPFDIYAHFMNDRVYFSIAKFDWFSISMGKISGLTASFNIGKERWLSYRLGPDYDEQLLWSFGPLYCTAPETDEQRIEREDAEAEYEFMNYEANRYTEWSY